MFLGYVSSKVVDGELSSLENYLGGSLKLFLPTSVLEPGLITCPNCHERMNFLMQIYCPLESCPDHRALHFFVCLQSHCQSIGRNWRVFKSQAPPECTPAQALTNTSDWGINGDNSDDESNWDAIDEGPGQTWSDESQPVTSQGDCQNPQMPIDSDLMGPFEARYIDVYEDEQSSQTDSIEGDPASSTFESWCQAEQIEQEFIDEDDNTKSGTFSGALQTYLASRTEYGCEAVRYSWSGKPIFDGLIPKSLQHHLVCHRCGAARVFELQLFPTLNNSLKLNPLVVRDPDHFSTHLIHLPEADKLNPDWLLKMTTVLVFSCSNSCSKTTEDNWVEECIVVQTDSGVTQILAPAV